VEDGAAGAESRAGSAGRLLEYVVLEVWDEGKYERDGDGQFAKKGTGQDKSGKLDDGTANKSERVNKKMSRDELPQGVVRSPDGTPKVFYRGSRYDSAKYDPSLSNGMIFFSPDREYTTNFGDNIHEVHIAPTKVLDLTGFDAERDVPAEKLLGVLDEAGVDTAGLRLASQAEMLQHLSQGPVAGEIARRAKAAGYDAIVLNEWGLNGGETESWAVLDEGIIHERDGDGQFSEKGDGEGGGSKIVNGAANTEAKPIVKQFLSTVKADSGVTDEMLDVVRRGIERAESRLPGLVSMLTGRPSKIRQSRFGEDVTEGGPVLKEIRIGTVAEQNRAGSAGGRGGTYDHIYATTLIRDDHPFKEWMVGLDRGGTSDAVLLHEIGHVVHSLLGKDVGRWESLWGAPGRKHVSGYAKTNSREGFAESFSAFTSSDPKWVGRIPDDVLKFFETAVSKRISALGDEFAASRQAAHNGESD